MVTWHLIAAIHVVLLDGDNLFHSLLPARPCRVIPSLILATTSASDLLSVSNAISGIFGKIKVGFSLGVSGNQNLDLVRQRQYSWSPSLGGIWNASGWRSWQARRKQLIINAGNVPSLRVCMNYKSCIVIETWSAHLRCDVVHQICCSIMWCGPESIKENAFSKVVGIPGSSAERRAWLLALVRICIWCHRAYFVMQLRFDGYAERAFSRYFA